MAGSDGAAGASGHAGAQREVSIRMPDGVSLAATLWLPAQGRQPCLLEALPYRKDDLTSSAETYLRLRDEYGYAVCRVDLRGTGSSAGDATDEYPPTERDDLAVVISWLADQDWCDGNIGMWGTSYSGFNSLQVACERPPALKAVCAIYASDDRWTDDVHWRGGALRLLDTVDYCHYMTPMNALPPVPAVWGEGWRAEWRRRVDTFEPWLLTWLAERTDGAYWRQGSVRQPPGAPGYERIDCPTMLVAGWADGYRNNTFRTVAALREAGVPHRLLAGPWAHASPETAMPGPRIDLVPEMVAWWDRWLRGRDNGVDTDVCTIFVRSSTRPQPDLEMHAGYWVREQWPSPRVATTVRELDGRVPYPVRADVGTAAWIDCAGHLPWGLSDDQRLDDAASLTWTWDADSVQLLGHPVVRLRLSADAPTATVSAKLCDVFADGTSALVTRGSIALAEADPGIERTVDVTLDACGYAFADGHRLRLSVAGADWPNTVAPPRPLAVTVHGGQLELPVWSGDTPYAAPVLAPGADRSGEDSGSAVWRVERDVLARTTACVVDHGTSYAVPYGGEASERYTGRVEVDTRRFEQRSHADVRYELAWPGISVSTRSTLDLRIGPESYDVDIWLEAKDGDQVLGERRWSRRLPR
jgi:hypothetical protein